MVDTSRISIAQLKVQLSNIFFGSVSNVLKIQCKSFGFKYGSDTEADLVVDVRCLPNPFYVEELKEKTGLDKEVRDYVMASEDSKRFLDRLLAFIDCAVPMYAKEGKSQLVISIGCTGGHHRSVTIAEALSHELEKRGNNVITAHRDIAKNI